jgi:hypothetical protein
MAGSARRARTRTSGPHCGRARRSAGWWCRRGRPRRRSVPGSRGRQQGAPTLGSAPRSSGISTSPARPKKVARIRTGALGLTATYSASAPAAGSLSWARSGRRASSDATRARSPARAAISISTRSRGASSRSVLRASPIPPLAACARLQALLHRCHGPPRSRGWTWSSWSSAISVHASTDWEGEGAGVTPGPTAAAARMYDRIYYPDRESYVKAANATRQDSADAD